MKENNTPQEMQVTQVHNVVILDRSGSMHNIRRAAVDGFNETLAGIKKAQEKFADTQDHYVTLVTFCGCQTLRVFDNTPVTHAHPLKMDDYRPCCNTPLYDAMGFTLTDIYNRMKDSGDAVVVVTIITDGMENSSKEYNGTAIKHLVERLRGEGWTFTYMGANQDAVEVAMHLSIRNARNFAYTDEGTRDTMQRDSSTRMNFFSRLDELKIAERAEPTAAFYSVEERRNRYTALADEAFDEEESR